MKSSVQSFKKIKGCNSGATSLEFALVAPVFLVMIFTILEVGYKSLLQTELDAKLYETASIISLNDFPSETSADFIRDIFCEDVGTTLLTCSKVQIGVKEFTNQISQHKDTTFIGTWETGCESASLIVEMTYPLTNLSHPIVVGDIITVGEDKFYRARGVVRREPILSGSGAC